MSKAADKLCVELKNCHIEIDLLKVELAEAKARADVAEADARRWQWVKRNCFGGSINAQMSIYADCAGKNWPGWDAYIDQQIEKEGKGDEMEGNENELAPPDRP